MEIEIEGVWASQPISVLVGKSGKIAAADFYSLISKAKPLTVVGARVWLRPKGTCAHSRVDRNFY